MEARSVEKGPPMWSLAHQSANLRSAAACPLAVLLLRVANDSLLIFVSYKKQQVRHIAIAIATAAAAIGRETYRTGAYLRCERRFQY